MGTDLGQEILLLQDLHGGRVGAIWVYIVYLLYF